jgi:hypothetical protein
MLSPSDFTSSLWLPASSSAAAKFGGAVKGLRAATAFQRAKGPSIKTVLGSSAEVATLPLGSLVVI